MRHLALLPTSLFATAGCLSAPTGQPLDARPIDAAVDAFDNAWPPPDADIVGLSAGPIDGDALDDVIAVDGHGGRLYFFKGGRDIVKGQPVTRAGASVAIPDLRAPASALVYAGPPVHLLVLDSPESGSRLSVFGPDLAPTGDSLLAGTPPSGTQLVTLTAASFGASGGSVFLTTPTKLAFVEEEDLGDAEPLLRMPGTNVTLEAFTDIKAAAGYITTPLPRVFVAEPTRVQRADASGPTFTWSSVRSGSVWTGHAVADIDDDGKEDLVGYEAVSGTPASSKICVLAVDEGGGVTRCAATPFMMGSAILKIGDLTGAGQHDVVLLDPMGPQGAGVFAATDLRPNGAAAAVTITTQPENVSAMGARIALAQLDAGGKEILVMARDGAVTCLRWSGTDVVPCS